MKDLGTRTLIVRFPGLFICGFPWIMSGGISVAL